MQKTCLAAEVAVTVANPAGVDALLEQRRAAGDVALDQLPGPAVVLGRDDPTDDRCQHLEVVVPVASQRFGARHLGVGAVQRRLGGVE